MDTDGTVVEESFGPKIVSEAPAPARPSAEEPPSSSTAPSSPQPADSALFSDNTPIDTDQNPESPPSSPPCRLPSPELATRKPAFSFLKRKRSARDGPFPDSNKEPLAEIDHNSRKIPRLSKKPLTQMQIDLGGEVRKTCRICGMEYIPSNKEDAALHKDFHAMNLSGVDLGKPFLKDEGVKRISLEGRSEGETIVVVGRRNALGVRNKIKRVLEVVNTELSAADIQDDQLWGGLPPNAFNPSKRVIETRNAKSDDPDKRRDRFKAFIYLVGDKCVGFCLAENIVTAYQVIDSQADHEITKVISNARSSSITASTTADAALLGISRIWVSKSHRGQGIAIELLDYARNNFFYGMEVPKDLVAFSQPTDSGGQLAKRWFRTETGWHVYKGDS